MLPVPKLAGVYVTEHIELAFSAHVVALNWVLEPVLVLHVTVPVGVIGPPPVTVAVHTVGALTGSGEGVQLIEVVVPSTTCRLNVPLLVACVASPA